MIALKDPIAGKAPRPLVSVVITCFNYARYVGAAIESALSQDYAPLEVVVVNDGSQDDSLDVIRRYAGRVRIVDQPNQGHVVACNHGFAASSGAIVVFLDADDLLEPGALSHVVPAFSPSTAKVQYDLKIIDGKGRDLGRRACYFSREYDASQVRAAFRATGTYRWPITAGNAYARWFLDALFPLTAKDAPDGILNTVAPVYGDVATIPLALACYRLHGANRWAHDGANPSRLSKRIGVRQEEVAFMRRHAEERGVSVPEGNVLDHEIVFLNYRLMALRLGFDYEGRDDDTPGLLLRRAIRVLRRERLPPRMTAAHLIWFAALAAATPSVARALYGVRANRSAPAQAVRDKIEEVKSRFTHAKRKRA
jgi:glycosyltransferase involved in cell wall biosynthesis